MALYFVFLGKQGAGKSTYMKGLSALQGLPRISSGELFREETQNKTEIGEKLASFMNAGKLVPDSMVLDLLKRKIDLPAYSKGIIFDGFPRTIGQAHELEKILEKKHEKLDAVFDFTAPEAVLLERLTGRRQCRKCGKIYHLKNMPPKEPGKCDACQGELFQREDDKPEAIRKRWKEYDERTKPLIEYYEGKRLLHSIDAQDSIDAVVEQLEKALKEVLENA